MKNPGPDRAFLERMTVIMADDGTALEGLYHGGDRSPAVLIAAPHPCLGGSMDSPVCAQLAWACSQRGHATLRFNYRGVGASTGELCGDERDLRDLLAAIAHLAETHPESPLALIGYSFGASLVAAALVEGLRPARVVLIAPAASQDVVDWADCPSQGTRCLVAIGGEDALVDPAFRTDAQPPMDATVQWFEDVDHYFSRRLSELGRLCADHIGGRSV